MKQLQDKIKAFMNYLEIEDTEYKKMKQLKDKIKAIMNYYEIEDTEYKKKIGLATCISQHIILVMVYHKKLLPKSYSRLHYSTLKEIAILIDLLRTCHDKDITIKGIVNSPHDNFYKDTEMTAILSANNSILPWLDIFLNTWLANAQDGVFEELFKWTYQPPLKTTDYDGEEEEHPFYLQPYVNEQIWRIIDYIKHGESCQMKMTKNGKLGARALSIIDIIAGVNFKNTTKRYSFVYDVMHELKISGKNGYIGEGFSGDIGREKAQQIRNWINAYHKCEEKHQSKINQ